MPDPTWNLIDTTFAGNRGGFDSGELVTEDGRDCLKRVISVPANDGVGNNNVSFEYDYTIEFVVKLVFGPASPEVTDSAYLYVETVGDAYNYEGYTNFYCNGSFPMVYTKSTQNNATTTARRIPDMDLTSWHKVRWISSSNVTSLYVNDYLLHTGVISNTVRNGILPGVWIHVYVAGNSTAIAYFDSFKMSSTPKHPDPPGGIRIQGVDLASRPVQPGTSTPYDSTWVAPSPLQFRTGHYHTSSNFEIPLVATNNSLASKVRIRNGSTTYSLQKLPTF